VRDAVEIRWRCAGKSRSAESSMTGYLPCPGTGRAPRCRCWLPDSSCHPFAAPSSPSRRRNVANPGVATLQFTPRCLYCQPNGDLPKRPDRAVSRDTLGLLAAVILGIQSTACGGETAGPAGQPDQLRNPAIASDFPDPMVLRA